MRLKSFSISSALLIVVFIVSSNCIRILPPKSQHDEKPVLEVKRPWTDDPGDPLILTPLIKEGKIQEARQKSIVGKVDDFLNVTSYSGYFNVKKDDESNSFFWFFPAEENFENAPVILWLQGGPGDSSLQGLFNENGPFEMIITTHIDLREHRWTKTHSILYIDNPVGVGFSTTKKLRQDQEEIGDDLYEALLQFFTMFPELQKNDFIIAGESYAGKYTTTIAYKIHKENPNARLKINLKALAIDSGMVDPINQHSYSDYWYQAGLIDRNTTDMYKNLEKDILGHILEKRWKEAAGTWSTLVLSLTNASGVNNYYNYLETVNSDAKFKTLLADFFHKVDIRKAIHVGKTDFDSGDRANEALRNDTMKSVAPKLSELLSHYRVLIYNGQVDIIVPYPLTVNYLEKLQFKASEEYKTAPRKLWKVNKKAAGYVKVAGKLTEVMVRKAGHMVAYNQPGWVYDLIYKFIRNVALV